jgi:putative phosphoesterase
MRIGLISDTHIPGGAMEMPEEVARAFEGVKLILHSGNIFNSATLDWLERIAPVKAAGSVDRDHQSWNDPRVAEKQIVEVEGHTIGVIHDLAVPGIGGQVYPGTIAAYYPANASLSTDMEKIFDSKVSIVIFGHTHEAMAEEHNGVLLINPGSPTLPNQLRKLGNVMILELTSGERGAKVVALADFS